MMAVALVGATDVIVIYTRKYKKISFGTKMSSLTKD
jgi:hypothetical protein